MPASVQPVVTIFGTTICSLQPVKRPMWCRQELMRCMANFHTQLNNKKAKIIAVRSKPSSSDLMDPAFKVIPKGCTCFFLWRVENFQLVPVPADQYGCFFDGDSYLVFASVQVQGRDQYGSLTQVKEVRGSLDMRIHFWLGENTTQDESGTAAQKAIELDEYLGCSPVQYREVQGCESSVFLNYFKKLGGVRYTQGSYASGFSHVDYTVKPRLMLVKGKHYPRLREVPIVWSSMNDGDVYILDVGSTLYVWNGKSSSRAERIKAMDFARKLRDDRGKCNLHVVDDGSESSEQMGEDAYELFTEYLPLVTRAALQPAAHSVDDDMHERKALSVLKLWKCSEEGTQLRVVEVARSPLAKQLLDTKDCFIVDNGEAGVWVWCGRNASKRDKQEAMNNAAAFIMQRNYANDIPLAKIYEGCEPTEFKLLFNVWEKERLPGQSKPQGSRMAQTTIQTRFDASVMYENPQIATETGMVDDGSGSRKIWRVERGRDGLYGMVELERKHIGQLYGGDCYVILYSYFVNKHERHIVYVWLASYLPIACRGRLTEQLVHIEFELLEISANLSQIIDCPRLTGLGKKATSEEMGVAAQKAVEIDDSLGGIAKQVRVVHGKEPSHFLAIFGGRLVIFAGGKAGFGSQQQDEGPSDTYLLQVHGTAAYNTKAEQVPCRAESLNSNDVFVLFSKSGVFVWAGKGCTGDEREMAKQIASVSPRGYHMMTEGQEKEDFWNILGGKGEYSNSPRLQLDNEPRPPRLFHCPNACGSYRVSEILEFSQQDLISEDVFFLDTYDNVYVWLGQEARPEEKALSMDAALDYVQTDPSGRPKDTPIFIIKQGLEPPDFIGYFGVWDRDLWSSGKTYEKLRAELCEKNTSAVQVLTKIQVNGDTSFSELAKYPYEVLCRKDDLPEGIDTNRKEKHLNSDDFQKVFGMTFAEFVLLPIWKQQQLKKQNQLW